MKMIYSWQAENYPTPDKQKLQALLKFIGSETLPELGDDFECSLVFVEDDAMAKINWDFLRHEGTTDVITFDYFNSDELDPGDTALEIIVCTDFAAREGADRADSDYASELALYTAHGFLHAAGFDDLSENERLLMRRAEAELMRKIEDNFNVHAIFQSPGAQP